MTDCPHCEKPLEGLGRFCHACEKYTDDGSDERAEAVHIGATDTRPEEEIRRDVVKALRALGFVVHDTEQDRPTRVTAGLPDLFIAGHGAAICVEMKSLKGKQTPEQADFERSWTANGGTYFIWRSLDDALAWVREIEGA